MRLFINARSFCFFLLAFLLFPFSFLHAAMIEKVTSAKGITAWLVEDHALPVVAMSFSFEGGLEQDFKGREGLSYLAANLLTEGGAGADDANTFQKKLQENAISLGFSAVRDDVQGSLRSLTETLPQAFALLKASLTAPRFENAALVRLKAQQLSELKANLADPNWLITRLMFQELFKGHPYATRALGTEESLKAITRADVQGWHKRLTREGLKISVAGDVTADMLKKMLDDVFGDLPEKTLRTPVSAWAMSEAMAPVLLHHEGPQSEIALVWPGLKRDDKDWYASEVLNYIFGGGSFSSRLMKEIRDRRGLTYGVSSSPLFYDFAALYMVQTSTPNDKVPEVLGLIHAEARRLIETPVTDEELAAAKDYLIGAYPLQLSSSAKIAGHYLSLQRYGLSDDEQGKRAKAIRAVTVGDIKRLATRIFSVAPQVFLVGAPESVEGVRSAQVE